MDNQKLLEGKIAVVTGGSRGIGRSIVQELHRCGAAVVFTHTGGSALPAADENGHGRIIAVQADVRDFTRAQEVVRLAIDTFGGIDLLVNNAGVAKDRPLMLMSSDEWQEVIDINLSGTFQYTRAAVKHLVRRKAGRIIQISSVGAIKGASGQSNYSASKAGLLGMTRALARELAPFQITVNAVLPGFIETEMTAKLPQQRQQTIKQEIPCSRFGRPEEVAKLVCFLASDHAAYITGQAITIDGGLSA